MIDGHWSKMTDNSQLTYKTCSRSGKKMAKTRWTPAKTDFHQMISSSRSFQNALTRELHTYLHLCCGGYYHLFCSFSQVPINKGKKTEWIYMFTSYIKMQTQRIAVSFNKKKNTLAGTREFNNVAIFGK